MKNFEKNLESKISSAIWHNYKDNHDHYRFGPVTGNSVVTSLAWAGNVVKLNLKGTRRIIAGSALGPYLERLNRFYQLLADDLSRDLLVQLAAYRILGKNKVKLPLCTAQYWQGIESIKSCIKDPQDIIQLEFLNWRLDKINLRSLGIPVDMYFTIKGIFTEFILRQYEYQKNGISVSVKEGDTVIDAGACWGDTALLFSFQAGETGQVHSFEFLPSNIDIFRRNLLLNPMLAERIKLVGKPLWDISGKAMYHSKNGPASQVSFDKLWENCGRVETASIDSYVEQNNIRKVDFIKMDIEGAESFALKGAFNTIRQFKPKLAIAIYHTPEDFSGIAELINSMDLGYRFHLDHFTIHAEETILYAS